MLGQYVVHQFQQVPTLPGVIIREGNRAIGLMSRAKLLEYLYWHPAPADLLKRPVEAILEGMTQTEAAGFLILPNTCLVQTGAIAAAERSQATVSDPIIVTFPDQSDRLLNLQDLVLAHAQILKLYHQSNLHQRQQLRSAHQTLQQAQTKIEQTRQDFSAHHLAQQRLLQHHQNLSEQHQSKLTQQIERMEEIKQRQQQIEQFFSEKGVQYIQSALETSQDLFKKTLKIGMMNQVLGKELATVEKAAQLTKQIGRQVQFLGLRAAILANRAGSDREGFSQVTADIQRLSSQARETAQSMEELVVWLKSCLTDLEITWQEGTNAAKALTQQAWQLKHGLRELSLLPELRDAENVTHQTDLTSS